MAGRTSPAATLDPYYETVEANLPVTQLVWRTDDPDEAWRQVPRRGSAWAEVMGAAGHTVLPLRQAVQDCVHCGWCNAGCRFGAKRDLTKSYLPGRRGLGATVRAGVEVRDLVRAPPTGGRCSACARTGPGPADIGPEAVLVEADHVVLAGGTVATHAAPAGERHHATRTSAGTCPATPTCPSPPSSPSPPTRYQGVAMDTVTFDFLRPETTGPHAADKFIVISQHMLPLSTLVCGHGGHRPARRVGPRARSTATADFGRHFIGLAVIGLDEQEGTIEGPEVHASDGVRLLPLRYPVSPATQAVWDRAKQVCRDAVEAAGGTFVDLARELANPQTAHPLGGARMAADAADGVVDPDGFVHGVEGLSVLDGAFVPVGHRREPVAHHRRPRRAGHGQPRHRPRSARRRHAAPRRRPRRRRPHRRPSPRPHRPGRPAPRRAADPARHRRHRPRRRRRGRAAAIARRRAAALRRRPACPTRGAFVIRAALALLAIAAARASSRSRTVDPPFTCEVIDYGTEPPELPAPADDPLCVRYDKTNITVSTLGVVDFLAAEPGRVAIVAGKCSYWQQDHWVVRATPGHPADRRVGGLLLVRRPHRHRRQGSSATCASAAEPADGAGVRRGRWRR